MKYTITENNYVISKGGFPWKETVLVCGDEFISTTGLAIQVEIETVVLSRVGGDGYELTEEYTFFRRGAIIGSAFLKDEKLVFCNAEDLRPEDQVHWFSEEASRNMLISYKGIKWVEAHEE